MPNIVIDPNRRCVYIAGQEIRVTPQEYRILVCLGRKSENIVLKAELLQALWPDTDQDGAGSIGNPAAVDIVIFRLRKKLGDDVTAPTYLETRRGFGYILHRASMTPQGRQAMGNSSGVNGHGRDQTGDQFTSAMPDAGALISVPDADCWDALTRREWEIFLLLGDEQATRLTNRALARRLEMAENTLKKHLQRIYRKLGVGNRAGAALLAMRAKDRR